MTIPTYPEYAAGVKQIIGLEQQVAGLVDERDHWKERAGTLEAANTRLTFAATENAETYRATQATCDALRDLVHYHSTRADKAEADLTRKNELWHADRVAGLRLDGHEPAYTVAPDPFYHAEDELTETGYTYRELTEALAAEVTP